MACKDCDKFQEEGNIYWLRFGSTNIGISCCEKHFKEVREKLLR